MNTNNTNIINKTINIQICYPAKNLLLNLIVEEKTTIKQALEISNIYIKYPEISSLDVGIFSKVKNIDTALTDLDRIEIYSPLIADPKEQREKRAAKKRLESSAEKSKWNITNKNSNKNK